MQEEKNVEHFCA